MKIRILLSFLLLTLSFASYAQNSKYKLTEFKTVPDEMTGCGYDYYLSVKSKKAGKFILHTDLTNALIYLNNKPVILKSIPSEKVDLFKKGDISVTITESNVKKKDDEYYTMDAIIVLRKGNVIIWKRKLIGDGGC